MRRFAAIVTLACVLTLSVSAQRPTYPEGSATPKHTTAPEAEWLVRNPWPKIDVVTPPPTGPIHCVAEYEPMDAILVAWEGPGSWLTILATMARHITTTGNADMWVVVDNANERGSATTRLRNAGADMDRVKFHVIPTDTIWMRDYGPRYIYLGEVQKGVRVQIDHTYNQPRPRDNAMTTALSPKVGHKRHELPLRHGGGNYHLDALRRARTTRLIVNENRQYTQQQIHDIWEEYQNTDTQFYQPFPRSVDLTQHIDMWMQVIADDEVVLSTWPFNPGSTQANICNQTAASMAAEGYTVHRVPARSVGGVHYTYTNMVMCNGLALIPSYSQPSVAQHNAAALKIWQQALPNHTVVQVPCQAIVTAAGVMHCIVMHVPSHKGGVNPTAYLTNLNGQELMQPGTTQDITWITDDDEGVQNVDLLLSTDGGATFPTVLASAIPDTGQYTWTIPSTCTGLARIRVVARDAQGNTGFDDSDANFGINGTGCGAASITYGTGTAGPGGIPTLTSTPPVVGSPFAVDVANAEASMPSVMLLGLNQTSFPLLGTTLLVQPIASIPVPISAAGTARLVIRLPGATSQNGLSLFWQDYILGSNLAATAGLETRVGF